MQLHVLVGEMLRNQHMKGSRAVLVKVALKRHLCMLQDIKHTIR